MAIVMSAAGGGPFGVMRTLARCGIFGSIADVRQWMSWGHEDDLVRAVTWLIEHDDVAGPVNVAAPNPVPQRDFARGLREAVGMPLGLPVTAWMFELATVVHRTDSELLLKSRKVVPGRLTRLESPPPP